MFPPEMIADFNATLERHQGQFDELPDRERLQYILNNSGDNFLEVKAMIQEERGWDDDRFQTWLFLRNPGLGNISPAFMLSVGRGDTLRRWVYNQLNGYI